MDGVQFDAWTKRFATRRSRRTLLRGLAGGLVATAGLGRADRAQARCPRDIPTRCGEECVDLRTDPSHCGRCANACAADHVCYAGRCLAQCPSGFAQHEGTCVRTCPAGMEECGGACVPACPENFVLDDTCACVCVPTTCGEDDCGFVSDGCGSSLYCGACCDGCLINQTCESGPCVCVNAEGNTTGVPPGYSCCPDSYPACTGSGGFLRADTCTTVGSCPAGFFECIGSSCRACCPDGSTCDDGACRQ